MQRNHIGEKRPRRVGTWLAAAASLCLGATLTGCVGGLLSGSTITLVLRLSDMSTTLSDLVANLPDIFPFLPPDVFGG